MVTIIINATDDYDYHDYHDNVTSANHKCPQSQKLLRTPLASGLWLANGKGKYIHDDADDQAWLVNGKRKYIHEPQVG